MADTNVVSEFMRDAPDPAVLTWAGSLSSSELTICVVTVEEIERGIGRLPDGRRRRDLEQRWRSQVSAFRDVMRPYDLAAAQATADVLVSAEAAGRVMSLADAQIAGICLANGDRLATRNVSDFSSVAGLELIDPFG